MTRAVVVLGACVAIACSEPTKPPSAPAEPTPTATTTTGTTTTPTATATGTPTATTRGSTSCEGPAPGPGYECLQACGPPVSRPSDPPQPFMWMAPDQVLSRRTHGCPRCLLRGTKIATPAGDVPVDRLHAGDPIFTTDAAGRKRATVVRLVSWTRAPRDHRMVRIRLADGRSLVASPGHPSADGLALGLLTTGAALDHGRVVAVESLSLDDDRTFDVLPEGETGRYWAEGVLVGSTLSR